MDLPYGTSFLDVTSFAQRSVIHHKISHSSPRFLTSTTKPVTAMELSRQIQHRPLFDIWQRLLRNINILYARGVFDRRPWLIHPTHFTNDDRLLGQTAIEIIIWQTITAQEGHDHEVAALVAECIQQIIFLYQQQHPRLQYVVARHHARPIHFNYVGTRIAPPIQRFPSTPRISLPTTSRRFAPSNHTETVDSSSSTSSHQLTTIPELNEGPPSTVLGLAVPCNWHLIPEEMSYLEIAAAARRADMQRATSPVRRRLAMLLQGDLDRLGPVGGMARVDWEDRARALSELDSERSD
ncbi:hypothetical protein B0J12DRAFT_673482 [Macrophomina phaseolina]|uniref:Uncharacterized protein n=1 Tax=Macrophomina phaseolina TaxID=35725 RepID=A0ABQ8G258_9PEZI|nr:hypothetical protein B0J12DRAFT_673482 [Macrophomina phaseolina]